jgi:hypothetical protein
LLLRDPELFELDELLEDFLRDDLLLDDFLSDPIAEEPLIADRRVEFSPDPLPMPESLERLEFSAPVIALPAVL